MSDKESPIVRGVRGTACLPIDTVRDHFPLIHLSYDKLGNYDAFVFQTRTPRNPYFDPDGNVIEDNFTPRISVSPDIHKAVRSLVGTGSHFFGYVYGLLKIPDSDVLNMKHHKNIYCQPRLNYVKNGATVQYGESEDLDKHWKLNEWLKYKKQREPLPPNDSLLNPNALFEYKDDFYGCIPDDISDEHWITKDTLFYYLGTYDSDDGYLVPSEFYSNILTLLEKRDQS